MQNTSNLISFISKGHVKGSLRIQIEWLCCFTAELYNLKTLNGSGQKKKVGTDV